MIEGRLSRCSSHRVVYIIWMKQKKRGLDSLILHRPHHYCSAASAQPIQRELAGSCSSRRGSIPTGEHYVIRQGDTLENISKRAYGTFDRWPGLWGLNLSVIDDCEDLPVGMKIFIPK